MLLEGLAGERWALVTKTHHCLVDGMSGVDVTNLLLDDAPPSGPDVRDGAVAPSADPRHARSVAAAAGAAVAVPVSIARAGADLVTHPRLAGELVRRTRAVAELVVRDELIGAPHTSLNVPIGGSRRFAVARADLDGEGDQARARRDAERRRAAGGGHGRPAHLPAGARRAASAGCGRWCP